MTSETLHVAEPGRYDRQERITWWDQRRLTDARVVVVGAGALGNEIVKNLALMGVGSIVIIDHDHVEFANLARCVLFRDGDDGGPKALIAAERARELNPEIEVFGVDADIRSFGTGLAMRAHVLVGALDNREARLYLNRLAWRCGRPWIDGAIEALEGVARVFSPPESCYECTLTARDWEIIDLRRSCRLLTRDELFAGRVPTSVGMAAIVGGIESQEVIKLLHRQVPIVNMLKSGIVVSGSSNDTYTITYPLLDDCLAHHSFGPLIELDITEVANARAIAGAIGADHVTVELNDDYIVEWSCPSCRTSGPGSGPLSTTRIADAMCDGCGDERVPSFVTTVGSAGPHGELDFKQLGLRPDEVLPVRTSENDMYVWFRDHDERLPTSWSSA